MNTYFSGTLESNVTIPEDPETTDMTFTKNGTEYSVVCIPVEESRYVMNVCEVAADGGPGRLILDEADSDEYESVDECIAAAYHMAR